MTSVQKSSGSVFTVVAPSGAGKSSLVNAVLKGDPQIFLSVSCTTRPPRPGEEHNKHYRFVSLEAFHALREKQQLLEWAQVHDNFYGTPRDRIDQALAKGQDVILEIDWQGAQQIRQFFPETIGIFILPPSIEVLKERLEKRGQDDTQVIARRLAAAHGEISHAEEFQYVIINQDFNTAVTEIQHIIAAARLRYAQQAMRHVGLFSNFGIK